MPPDHASAGSQPLNDLERRRGRRTAREKLDDLFEGRVCLVTGGAQGVGWAIAQAMADHGAEVFVCDVSEKNIARARGTLAELPFGQAIRLERCDVTDRPAMEQWIDGIYERHGQIDVLVNNAAFVRWEDFSNMSVEDDLLTMRVGYDAMVYTTHAILPRMLKAGRGHIVNIGSSAGKVYVGGSSAAYAAAKAAIEAYTRILSLEVRGTPVHLTLVRPGAIAGTDFFREHVSSQRLPRMGDFIPYLTPPKIAQAILRAIRDERDVLDIPGSIKLFYWLYELAPNLLRRVFALGGSGQRDYGAIEWRYTPAGQGGSVPTPK